MQIYPIAQDIALNSSEHKQYIEFSPHVRGWSRQRRPWRSRKSVFPACAGVILIKQAKKPVIFLENICIGLLQVSKSCFKKKSNKHKNFAYFRKNYFKKKSKIHKIVPLYFKKKSKNILFLSKKEPLNVGLEAFLYTWLRNFSKRNQNCQ